MIRQGDVLFIPIADPWEDVTKSKEAKLQPKGIIQEGEVTGHHHKLAVLEDAEVFEIANWQGPEKYVRVGENGVSIVHEEHHTVTLPPGLHKVHIAREFDYLGQFARFVAD